MAADYKNLSIVNACEGLNLLSEEDEGEEHAHGDAHEDAAEEHIHGDTEDTHEDGHNHGDVNAHAWMSIALYKQQVENILEGLCRIDPKHQDAYESNAKEYLAKLEDLEREQQSLKEELAGKHIVISMKPMPMWQRTTIWRFPIPWIWMRSARSVPVKWLM